MPASVTIRRALPPDLPVAAALIATTLRFTPADAVPAWLMRTTDECGGVTLVGVDGDAVVAASYALPACDAGTPYLFSCGLAVVPSHRGQGLGAALKRAQRREALALGYATIRWTTDPHNGRALRIYLSELGARITGYRAGLHDGLRADPGHPQDDLEVVWNLENDGAVDRGEIRTVELPWSDGALLDRRRVRAEMTALLADGYVGCAVDLDRATRRCRVAFARPLPDAET